MTTTHTTGPWHTFRQGTKHFVSQSCDEDFQFAHAVIFECNFHPDGSAAARSEAESNARLIAAAPDLLSALKALMARDLEFRLSGFPEVAQARAAIAKATGGAT